MRSTLADPTYPRFRSGSPDRSRGDLFSLAPLQRAVERGAESAGFGPDRARAEAERAVALARANLVAPCDGSRVASGLVLDLSGFVEAPGVFDHAALSSAARALSLAGVPLALGNLAGALIGLGHGYGSREAIAAAEAIAFAASRFAQQAEPAPMSVGLGLLGSVAAGLSPAASLVVTDPDGVVVLAPAVRRALVHARDSGSIARMILGTRRLGEAAQGLLAEGVDLGGLLRIEAALPRAVSMEHALALAGLPVALSRSAGLDRFEQAILGEGVVPGDPVFATGASETARRAIAQAFGAGLAAGRAAAEARAWRSSSGLERRAAPGRA